MPPETPATIYWRLSAVGPARRLSCGRFWHGRRRTLSTCAQAAGIVGQASGRQGDVQSTLRLCKLVTGLAAGEEPGRELPSYMKGSMVRENAGESSDHDSPSY